MGTQPESPSETRNQPTRVLNVSPSYFSPPQVILLCKGLSFCPTPDYTDLDFTEDLYQFSRKLRLKYQFYNNEDNDASIAKLPSTYTPPLNQDVELEGIIHKLKTSRVRKTKSRSNMPKPLREALRTLTDKVTNMEIVIKSADKGDITVIMSSEYYSKMCMNELSKDDVYKCLGKANPSDLVYRKVKEFADQYRSILTKKEYQFLTKKQYRMANFYSLPKLHKWAQVNQQLRNSGEYIHIPDFSDVVEGRPIVGGPASHTSGISEMIDIITKPIISYIPHILRDSFDYIERCSLTVPDGALLGTADVKALYTNLSRDLVIRAMEYWFNRYAPLIPILQRFGLEFIIDGLDIILGHNYFLFADKYFQQVSGFAMGTKAAVNCANLSLAYLEVKAFDQLPKLYPVDFVNFFIENYFRFLDDVDYSWLEDYDPKPFQSLFNELDPKTQFIFSLLSKESDFLDIHKKVVDYEVELDVFRKPTDAFNFLHYNSCHPKHTRNNIALSLAKRIVRISSHNRDARLDELVNNLVIRGHPRESILEAFSKVFTPRKEPNDGDPIVFTTTHNPSVGYPRKFIKNIFKDVQGDTMKKVFKNSRVIMGTRQPKSLRRLLIRSRFSLVKKKIQKQSGLYNCRGCKYHRQGFIKSCLGFTFGKNNEFSWEYRRFFNCNSKNVIYVLKCRRCWKFYIGETSDMKVRTRKHKSDISHPKNSNCRELAEHLRSCSSSPHFLIFPIMYVDDRNKRRFIESRLIKQFQPPLNGDGTRH